MHENFRCLKIRARARQPRPIRQQNLDSETLALALTTDGEGTLAANRVRRLLRDPVFDSLILEVNFTALTVMTTAGSPIAPWTKATALLAIPATASAPGVSVNCLVVFV